MAKKNMFKIGRKTALVLSAAMAISTVAWPARVPALGDAAIVSSTSDSKAADTITLEPGKAKKITLDQPIKTANILLPEVADVVALGPNELLITAKKAGSTQLILWDPSGHTQIMTVEVASPIEHLRKQLAQLFPDSKISAEDAAGTITLSGQVHDLQIASQAAQVALPYGTRVLNLLEIGGGQQVMLQVKFAEVSKQAEQELGFNFGGTDGGSFVGFGSTIGKNALSITQNGPALVDNVLTSTTGLNSSIFGQGGFNKIIFSYFIDALEQNSLVRTLAEPNLVTTSGQEATFLAGGSFPYPVPQSGTSGGSTITIQFQDYGVNLRFTPIVLGNGRIRLKVAPEVSELDFSHTVTLDGTSVPGLTKRNVETTVELAEGQTFALAGLLQDTVTAQNLQFPILGDIPVLGALFRSVQYQKNQTELVVLVTPVLVHGMDPADVTAVPGEKWHDPSSLELYMFKDLGGEPAAPPEKPLALAGQTPRFEGPVGFTPPPSSGK